MFYYDDWVVITTLSLKKSHGKTTVAFLLEINSGLHKK